MTKGRPAKAVSPQLHGRRGSRSNASARTSGACSAKIRLRDGDLFRGNGLTAGALVILTLTNPREKIWGALRALSPAGATLCGFDLSCFEDVIAQVSAGDPASASEVFFPMHRVERIELDAPAGAVPSLAEQFQQRTGKPAAALLGLGHVTLELGASLARAQSEFVAATLRAVGDEQFRAAGILDISPLKLRSLLR